MDPRQAILTHLEWTAQGWRTKRTNGKERQDESATTTSKETTEKDAELNREKEMNGNLIDNEINTKTNTTKKNMLCITLRRCELILPLTAMSHPQ